MLQWRCIALSRCSYIHTTETLILQFLDAFHSSKHNPIECQYLFVFGIETVLLVVSFFLAGYEPQCNAKRHLRWVFRIQCSVSQHNKTQRSIIKKHGMVDSTKPEQPLCMFPFSSDTCEGNTRTHTRCTHSFPS